ncbi:MAG: Cell wall assembly/cell proliferation coordinating protein KNR4-like protein [Mycobacterium sp.]|jgi:hypothetical protein|nr:Cell wall assembly/cell proliferation coordinating protein KNR4-like protein [Mycobacterium sp.]
MARELPHSEPEWRAYLQAFSEDVLTYDADDLVYATHQQRAARWLGTAGVREADVARREAELGVAFPPSYRNFLLTSDGWTHLGPFVYELREAGEVGWFPEKEPQFMAGWDDFDWPEIVVARRSLLVSGATDGAHIYLDPHDVGVHGEWAAWWYAHWEAEFTRYSSFSALVEAQWASFESMWTMDGRPPRPVDIDADVEAGREAIWAGDTLRGMALLEDAHARGSVRAGVLAEVFRAFHGRWSELGYLGQLLAGIQPEGLEADVVEAELVPLWRCAESFGQRDFARPSPRTIVENPEYLDALDACRDALSRGADAAWPLLQEAMRCWQPTSPYRLVPVSLILDPQLSGLLTPERAHELLARYA